MEWGGETKIQKKVFKPLKLCFDRNISNFNNSIRSVVQPGYSEIHQSESFIPIQQLAIIFIALLFRVCINIVKHEQKYPHYSYRKSPQGLRFWSSYCDIYSISSCQKSRGIRNWSPSVFDLHRWYYYFFDLQSQCLKDRQKVGVGHRINPKSDCKSDLYVLK